MHQAGTNLQYGPTASPTAQAAPAPHGTTGPGFISAPQQLGLPPSSYVSRPTVPTTGLPLPPPPPCPPASQFATAPEAASTIVSAPPKAGVYRFRRSGWIRNTPPGGTDVQLTTASRHQLSTEVIRQVTNVQSTYLNGTLATATYDVIESSPGLTVTTSYQIDQLTLIGGATAGNTVANLNNQNNSGLKITKIVTQRADLPGTGVVNGTGAGATSSQGTEVFTPQPPLKLLDLPLANEAKYGTVNFAQQSTNSRDSATGETETYFYRTLDRDNVDVCGRLTQGWQVQVGVPSDQQYAAFTDPGVRAFNFYGTFVFSPQMGFIVADDIHFGGPNLQDSEWGGQTANRKFEMQTAATIDSLTPSRP